MPRKEYKTREEYLVFVFISNDNSISFLVKFTKNLQEKLFLDYMDVELQIIKRMANIEQRNRFEKKEIDECSVISRKPCSIIL